MYLVSVKQNRLFLLVFSFSYYGYTSIGYFYYGYTYPCMWCRVVLHVVQGRHVRDIFRTFAILLQFVEMSCML